MADIFLSYAREDFANAKLLATALESKSWSVFWDTSSILPGQDFDEAIEKAIDAAKCMIVVWSEASKKSHYVRDEARKGRDRNILIPILVDLGYPPMGFGSIHTENFSSWNGDLNSGEFYKLQRAVERLLGSIKPSVVQRSKIIEPEMVPIPAGRFRMGSSKTSSEQPIHEVIIAGPFALGKYPVTFEEYDQFAEALGKHKPDDRGWGRGNRPVINVRWEDAVAYARWLSDETHKRFRLPTEAEWEYAARAGTTGDYYWGQNDAEDFAWFSENSKNKVQPVGNKKPNAFGLYDMSGNVWEWVQDGWHKNYDQAPVDGSAWQEQNTGDSTRRVLRGGSWFLSEDNLRSSARLRLRPDIRYNTLGFRLAQD